MINWEEITKNMYMAKVDKYNIIISRRFDTWTLTCDAFIIIEHKLGDISFAQAKQEACRIVAEAIGSHIDRMNKVRERLLVEAYQT